MNKSINKSIHQSIDLLGTWAVDFLASARCLHSLDSGFSSVCWLEPASNRLARGHQRTEAIALRHEEVSRTMSVGKKESTWVALVQ